MINLMQNMSQEIKEGTKKTVGAKNLSPKTHVPGDDNENQHLIKLAQEAIQQIDEKKYSESRKQSGISKLLKIGIGFEGKVFELASSYD